MGVCCIVFNIDGMVFEFFMIFFKYWKKKLRFFFKISCFLRVSCYLQHLKQNLVYKKIRGGGGGGACWKIYIFFFKQFFLISRFMLFSTWKTNIEKCPFTYWLNGRWFLQIVEGTVGIYIHYILYSLDLILYLKCGGCNVFLTFYAIYNISRKKFWEYKQKLLRKTIISHLMFSSCVFYAGNIEKFPFAYWLNGRWFLQIVDSSIGNFNMRLEILKSAPSLTVNWEVVSPNRRYTCREF